VIIENIKNIEGRLGDFKEYDSLQKYLISYKFFLALYPFFRFN